MAWRHPSSLPALPAAPPSLYPPAPRHQSLLWMLGQLPSTRKHQPLSNSGCPRATNLPIRSASCRVGCWAHVPRYWRAAHLPQSDGPNAGWRPMMLHPQAARGVQKHVTVLLNSTRQPREAGTCLKSAAGCKLMWRKTSRPHWDKQARRIALPEQETGCQLWAGSWGKLQEPPVPLKNKTARCPLHQ